MKRILVLAGMLLLAGCCDNPKAVPVSKPKLTDQIRYVKDSRTGLCFAVLGTLGAYARQDYSFTMVPCSVLQGSGMNLDEIPDREIYWNDIKGGKR